MHPLDFSPPIGHIRIMTPEQFAYWLQGFAEINDVAPTEDQWKIICDHLKLVFKKVTPERLEIKPIELEPIKNPDFPITWPRPWEPYPLPRFTEKSDPLPNQVIC